MVPAAEGPMSRSVRFYEFGGPDVLKIEDLVTVRMLDGLGLRLGVCFATAAAFLNDPAACLGSGDYPGLLAVPAAVEGPAERVYATSQPRAVTTSTGVASIRQPVKDRRIWVVTTHRMGRLHSARRRRRSAHLN
jgi:hypothetical protein